MHVANEVMHEVVIMALFMCNWRFTVCEKIVLPVFKPNQYLYETHKDKGNTEWEIFAWAVRDVMCKASGLAKHDQAIAEKIQYFKYLEGHVASYKLENSKDK